MQGDIESSYRSLAYKISEEQFSLNVDFKPKEILFLEHMKDGPASWLTKQLMQTYNVKVNNNSWIFENRYVLSKVDHSKLSVHLKGHLDRYELMKIDYEVEVFGKQISAMLREMKDCDEMIKFKDLREEKGRLTILTLRSNRDKIEQNIQKLKQFRKDSLIYPLDDYLSKTKLKQGVLKQFTKAIKKSINSRLKLYELNHDLEIKQIKPYQYKSQYKAGFKFGVTFQVFGHPGCYGKFYQFFQKWLIKLNWIILQVPQIVCCRRQDIQQWILENKRIKAILITPKQSKEERVVVISPKRDKLQLQRLLQTSTRIISGKEFPLNQFHLLYKYVSEFKCFLANSKGAQTNVKIYQHYILVDCLAFQEQKLRRRILNFLEMYKQQEHLVSEFKSEFEIQMFVQFYVKMVKSNPITYHMLNGQLYRTNSNKIQEHASSEINEIFKVMRKELVQKPLNKMIQYNQGLFKISKAPQQWQTHQCIQSKRFKLTDKIDICIRSYGSIQKSQTDGIFIVHQLQKCEELKNILRQDDSLTAKYEQYLIKHRIVRRNLRYCPYFESITIWLIDKDKVSQKRNSFAQKRLANDIQTIIKTSTNLMHLKIVLPKQSEIYIELFLRQLLEALLNNCNFGGEGRIQLTFYTSCNNGASLRKQIVQQLRRFVHRGENKVQKVCDYELRLEDIEKIVEYSYQELKYFDIDEKTKSVSPLNSYVFMKELSKKSQHTPIFLLSEEQIHKNKYSQYLICYFDKSVYEVRQGRAIKLKKRYTDQEELCKIAQLLKYYFKSIDYAVIYGSIDKDTYSKKLCLTSNKESMYKKFEQLHLLPKEKKILCKNNSVRISFEIVQNKYMQLYKVQTHPQLLDKLYELKKGHSLMN